MQKVLSRVLALSISGLILLSGCAGSLPENASSSGMESKTVTIEDVRSEADVYWQGVTYPQLSEPTSEMPILTLHTTEGDIQVVLYPEQAPKAVENFYVHARDGYYDGVIFHRVINDFMIQGGDPDGKGTGGESIWGTPFENETLEGVFNFRGALSMANSGKDTNGSQFFIVQNKDIANVPYGTNAEGQSVYYSADILYQMGYPQEVIDHYVEVGGYPTLDNGYTSFGQVLQGMDIVDKIAAVEVDSSDKPLTDVVITGITIDQPLPDKYMSDLTSENSEALEEVSGQS